MSVNRFHVLVLSDFFVFANDKIVCVSFINSDRVHWDDQRSHEPLDCIARKLLDFVCEHRDFSLLYIIRFRLQGVLPS